MADELSRKDSINHLYKQHVVGKGINCNDIILDLLNCWKLNTPTKEVVDKSAMDTSYFMHG